MVLYGMVWYSIAKHSILALSDNSSSNAATNATNHNNTNDDDDNDTNNINMNINSPSHRRGTLKGVPTVKSPNNHF